MKGIQLTHRTAVVNRVHLHYVIAGQGELVVLLHGWPETWYQWRKIIPCLAEKYTVIAPDMRGLGDSSKPATGYDKRTVADDIYRLVKKLGFERIFLVGHDWGGPVAYAYACLNPDSVRRLVILDVAIPGAGLEEIINELWHVHFHRVRDLSEFLVAGKEREYLSWFYRGGAHDITAIAEEDIDEYVRCYAAPGGMRAGFEYYRAIRTDIEHNRESMKTKLKMPVLALGGQYSLGTLALTSMQRLAENVRGEEISDCGHWISEEKPQVLLEHLLSFFGEERP